MSSEPSCLEFREIASQGIIFKFVGFFPQLFGSIFSINAEKSVMGFFESKILVDSVKRK